jgi:hypothetical protein
MLISETHPETGKNWLGFALRRHFGGYSSHIPLGFAAAAVAIHGALNILECMLSLGLLVNVRFRTEFNPFGFALPVASHDCMQLLFSGRLTHNAGMNRVWAAAALGLCHKYDAMDLFMLLLEKHIDVFKASDHADCKSMSFGTCTWMESPTPTLLNEAIWLREASMVDELIEAGWTTDVVYVVPGGATSRYKHSAALYDATRQGSISIVKILVDAGCGMKLAYHAGLRSPLDEARLLGEYLIVELLEKAGPVEFYFADDTSEAARRNEHNYEVVNFRTSWSRIFEQQTSQESELYDLRGNKQRSLSWIL